MKALYLFVLIFLLLFLSGCGGYLYENKNWVYVTYDEAVGRRVEKLNVDKDTFVILKNKSYAKDKNKVLFEGRVIEDANPNTFQVINNDGYSKDANYVFVDLEKVVNGNPQTFICLDFPYSKDEKTVYCGTLPMFVKNINEFKVTKRGEGKHTTLTSYFLKSNPDYSFIDPKKYKGVIYSDDSKGETEDQKFEGYKQVR
jgi:hypothetical protein